MKASMTLLQLNSFAVVLFFTCISTAIGSRSDKSLAYEQLRQATIYYRDALIKNDNSISRLVSQINFRIVESYQPLAEANINTKTITFSDQLYLLLGYLADMQYIPLDAKVESCRQSYKDYALSNIQASLNGARQVIISPGEYFTFAQSDCKAYSNYFPIDPKFKAQRDQMLNGVFFYIMLHEIAHVYYNRKISPQDYASLRQNEYDADAWAGRKIVGYSYPILYVFNIMLLDYMVLVPMSMDCGGQGSTKFTHPTGMNRIDNLARILLNHKEAIANPTIRGILRDTSQLASKARIEFTCSR